MQVWRYKYIYFFHLKNILPNFEWPDYKDEPEIIEPCLLFFTTK